MATVQPLSREEVLRRWNESKRRKQERIKRIEPSLREQFRRLNGKEATIIEIW